jgi:hypothetical protein
MNKPDCLLIIRLKLILIKCKDLLSPFVLYMKTVRRINTNGGRKMKKLIITVVVLTAVLAGTTTALAAQDNQGGFAEENGKAICEANGDGQCAGICLGGNDEANGACLRERVYDSDGDGVCDCLCDNDGDGVCDVCRNAGACPNDGIRPLDGTGMQYGRSDAQGPGNR